MSKKLTLLLTVDGTPNGKFRYVDDVASIVENTLRRAGPEKSVVVKSTAFNRVLFNSKTNPARDAQQLAVIITQRLVDVQADARKKYEELVAQNENGGT